MATIRSGILGEVQGRIGNIVYRKFNGKNVLSVRPDKYKIAKKGPAKNNRNKFAAAVKFCKAINNEGKLSSVWRAAKIQGTLPFNRILKHNLKYINEGIPSNLNTITPEGTVIPVTNIDYGNGAITVTVKNSLIPGSAKEISLFILLLPSAPQNQKSESFLTIILKDENVTPTGAAYTEITFNLAPSIKKQLTFYTELYCYSAVTFNPEKRKIFWSSTYFKKLA